MESQIVFEASDEELLDSLKRRLMRNGDSSNKGHEMLVQISEEAERLRIELKTLQEKFVEIYVQASTFGSYMALEMMREDIADNPDLDYIFKKHNGESIKEYGK